MIEHLRVRNFLLFEDVSVNLSKGLNVITGETGVGKSLIVDALQNTILPRVNWEDIRTNATVEIVLKPDDKLLKDLEEMGIDVEEDEILIRRVFDRDRRKSRVFINDFLISSKRLSEILSVRIFIGSQFSHVEITDERYQTLLYDNTVGIDTRDYEIAFRNYRELKDKFERITKEMLDIQSKEDFIRFQIKEIEEIDFEVSDEELVERRLHLEEKLREVEWITKFREYYEDIYDKLTYLLRSSPDRFKGQLEGVIEGLNEINLSLEVANTEDILSELDSINSKLYRINRLKAKYGTDFKGLLKIKDKLISDLKRLEELKALHSELSKKLEESERSLEMESKRIFDRRLKGRKEFQKRMKSLLKELGFDYVECEVELIDTKYWERGGSKVKIKISTIPNVEPSDISNLSGGEISRVALVMFYLGGTDYKSMVLDEIDVGVSPQVAVSMGRMLKEISKKVQIIAITHQPFISIFADKHFVVEKIGIDKAVCRELKGEDRIKEIGRMMGIRDIGVVRDVIERYANLR